MCGGQPTTLLSLKKRRFIGKNTAQVYFVRGKITAKNSTQRKTISIRCSSGSGKPELSYFRFNSSITSATKSLESVKLFKIT
jgi:hypothetical protein